MDWSKELPAAITICDVEGKIIYMNDKSEKVFEADGGKKLIGQSLFACHSNESNDKIRQILSSKEPNNYTIEKNGRKKFIHQTPWYVDGEIKGLVEFSFEIPFDMPHHVRS